MNIDFKKVMYGSSILLGTAIGAGILGLPYALKDNIRIGFFALLITGLVMIAINTMLVHVMHNTKKKLQLSGYSEIYLGKLGKIIMTVAFLFSMYGAILAYLLAMAKILFTFTQFSELFWYLILMFGVFIIVAKGINLLKNSELFLSGLLIALILFLAYFTISSMQFNFANFNYDKVSFFSLIGVTLFAYLNIVAVPELNEIFRFDKNYIHNMTLAVVFGTLIPFILYFLFVFSFAGVNALTNEVATLSLYDLFGVRIGVLANSIALLSMLTSYIALSYGIFQLYLYDNKYDRSTSLLLTFLIPILALYFILIYNIGFVKILDFIGDFAGSVQALMVILIYFVMTKNLKKLNVFNSLIITLTSAFFIGLLITALFF